MIKFLLGTQNMMFSRICKYARYFFFFHATKLGSKQGLLDTVKLYKVHIACVMYSISPEANQ